ncbi:DUF5686 family protein [Chryseolinea lacunae]|uniref:Carboxypeptidase-like regulatory domain-containing protein n=1 Tax=Chryseolinea lacunae TaxID=2801331 RepID=A0ABS1L386_9BACT|nr:DUF5686 family protein [Chryseolinea lacunae]MBL0745903.1 carboxypeptidase-like regulatory domain-containing protein [Chryseolinea lacunae]
MKKKEQRHVISLHNNLSCVLQTFPTMLEQAKRNSAVLIRCFTSRCAALLFVIVIAAAGARAQSVVSGKVIDSLSAQPIAFVSVTLEDGRHGTNSDIEGNFKLHVPAGYSGWVYFSHVSYRKIRLPLSALHARQTIRLKQSSTVLTELTFLSGENPAHKIIRKAIEHKKENDPDELKSYSYTSYSKFLVSPTEPDAKTDSIVNSLQHKPDSIKLNKDQKSLLQFDSLAKKSNLFISESVSERKVLNPGQVKEKLLAFQISGYKSPMFSSAAMDNQPFSFYDDNIKLFGKEYLNPLTPGTFKHYDFYLMDTTFYQADTVYVIQFSPRNKKFFNGLEGMLSIAVDGYAVKNIIATSADSIAQVGLRIQQDYEKIDNHWFPVQQNTDLDFHELIFAGRSLKAQQSSFLKDIKINPPLNPKDFGDITLELANITKDLNTLTLDRYRIRPLDEKELNTYTFLDSAMRKIRWIDGAFEALVTGYVPVGFVDVDLSKVASFNQYENTRLGLGLYTNDRFSKLVRVGGYYGYGLRDRQSKYGGEVKFTFNRNRDLFFRLAYAHDIYETGSLHENNEGQYLSNASFRKWVASRFDAYTSYRTEVGYRILPSVHARLSLQRQEIRPTYAYTLEQNGEPVSVFNLTEAQLAVRYVRRESYTLLRGKKIFLSHKYPIITASVTKALNLFDAQHFRYTIYDFTLKYQTNYWAIGKSMITFSGGLVDGVAPYGRLLNGRGAQTASFYVENYFQTMGLYEFTASKYAAVFFRHNFGNVLLNKKYSKPDLILFQHAGIGTLDHRELHDGVELASLDKGYLESGIALDNLVRVPYIGLGYFNFGGSVFYRYGPYGLPDTRDNLVFRFSFTFTF